MDTTPWTAILSLPDAKGNQLRTSRLSNDAVGQAGADRRAMPDPAGPSPRRACRRFKEQPETRHRRQLLSGPRRTRPHRRREKPEIAADVSTLPQCVGAQHRGRPRPRARHGLPQHDRSAARWLAQSYTTREAGVQGGCRAPLARPPCSTGWLAGLCRGSLRSVGGHPRRATPGSGGGSSSDGSQRLSTCGMDGSYVFPVSAGHSSPIASTGRSSTEKSTSAPACQVTNVVDIRSDARRDHRRDNGRRMPSIPGEGGDTDP